MAVVSNGAYTPEPPPDHNTTDPDEGDPDRHLERLLYQRALIKLTGMDPNSKWQSNFKLYIKWTPAQRDWWIRQIKLQAQRGLPMAIELIALVTELRMS